MYTICIFKWLTRILTLPRERRGSKLSKKWPHDDETCSVDAIMDRSRVQLHPNSRSNNYSLHTNRLIDVYSRRTLLEHADPEYFQYSTGNSLSDPFRRVYAFSSVFLVRKHSSPGTRPSSSCFPPRKPSSSAPTLIIGSFSSYPCSLWKYSQYEPQGIVGTT